MGKKVSPNPARPVAWLIIGIGVVLVAVALIYSFGNIAESVFGFSLDAVLAVGVAFVVVGVILLYLLKPVEVPVVDTKALEDAIADVQAQGRHLEMRLAAMEPRLQAIPVSTPVTAEDLQIIEGIGPRIAEALIDAKIDTFEKLANANVGQLYDAVTKAGIAFVPGIRSWPAQAEYVLHGDAIGFEKYTAELVGGRDTSREDDLTIIEGIGPKIAEALSKAGINTLDKLALASEDKLREALTGAGIPTGLAQGLPSWAKQAEYVMRGNVVGFIQYKQQLIGGRERPADQ